MQPTHRKGQWLPSLSDNLQRLFSGNNPLLSPVSLLDHAEKRIGEEWVSDYISVNEAPSERLFECSSPFPLLGDIPVHYCEMEVAVGEVIRLGNCVMTILDVDDEEITVKLDMDDDELPIIGRLTLSRPR